MKLYAKGSRIRVQQKEQKIIACETRIKSQAKAMSFRELHY